MGIHDRWDRAKAFTLPITTRIHLHPGKHDRTKFRAKPKTSAFERAKRAMDDDFARIVAIWKK
jgi:hypothetical protein